MEYFDQWLWLIFIIAGLLLSMIEIVIGVNTGLDLVFIGSSLILGGLVTWPFHSWYLAVIVTSLVCVGYVTIGRKYVHRWVAVKKEKTNIDVIIGKKGIVLKSVDRDASGIVKVGSEQWKAVSEEEISEGCEIEVVEIKGVTLTVKISNGGN